jgi:hypothetical protein
MSLAPVFTRISLLPARPAARNRSEGGSLARHERNFRSGAEAPLSVDELQALLGAVTGADERSREEAIACLLSGEEGWRDALKALGGAFAPEATGLKERKLD